MPLQKPSLTNPKTIRFRSLLPNGLLLIAIALFATRSPAATPAGEPAWRASMQGLFASLQGLLSLTVDPARFNDPANAAAIQSSAKKLAESAHRMAGITPSSPDADPSIRMFAAILEDQSQAALDAYQSGSREYARNLFNSTASSCIACHSRTDVGVKLDWAVDSGPAAQLPPHQKAQLLAAGRAYGPALEQLSKALADPELAKERPFDWNQALRTALVLSIRAEKDPARARKIIERAVQTPGVPGFVGWDARNWIRSLKEWEKETSLGTAGKAPGKPPSYTTEDQAHREALRLISQAQKVQRYPMDRTGDVLYLRASGVLHDQLRIAPTGPKSAEAFFLLGICYEVLRDFDLWTLGDSYYEACIKRQPHSELAESCYRKLEESTLAGYTGSAGTQVPTRVEQKLGRLKLEAQVLPGAPKR